MDHFLGNTVAVSFLHSGEPWLINTGFGHSLWSHGMIQGVLEQMLTELPRWSWGWLWKQVRDCGQEDWGLAVALVAIVILMLHPEAQPFQQLFSPNPLFFSIYSLGSVLNSIESERAGLRAIANCLYSPLDQNQLTLRSKGMTGTGEMIHFIKSTYCTALLKSHVQLSASTLGSSQKPVTQLHGI